MSEFKEKSQTITNLDPKTRSILIRYVLTDFTRLIAFSISGMFIILYLLDTLESTQVGMLFALSYFILALIDYPTGVLGDIIGYRKVMLVAYFFHIISFIFLLISLFRPTFTLQWTSSDCCIPRIWCTRIMV